MGPSPVKPLSWFWTEGEEAGEASGETANPVPSPGQPPIDLTRLTRAPLFPLAHLVTSRPANFRVYRAPKHALRSMLAVVLPPGRQCRCAPASPPCDPSKLILILPHLNCGAR